MGEIKKIFFFLDFSNVVGGSNKVLLTQAYIMKQRGYQVRMVIPVQEGMKPIEECNEICKRYGLEIIEASYTVATCIENIDILKALGDYKEIVRLLEMDRPDLIHSAQLNIAVEFAARELKIPHLMNIYQVDKEAFNLNWMEIFPQYHSADSCLFSERWSKGLGIPSRCIRVAYEADGYNIEKTEKKDYITIITIGVFCEHKNQLEILKFILRCKDVGKNAKIIFLGSNQNRYGEKCREFVERHELEDYVKFEGFVLNIEDYFREADLFILASTVESYPGVIVESMSNRVPIISTPVAGVPELLSDEKNGFLTRGYEANDLYEAFLRYLLLQDKGEISQIVENAYSTYLENHTYDAVGIKLDGYYQWIEEDYHNKNISYLTADVIEQKFQNIFMNKEFGAVSPEVRSLTWFLVHVFSEIEQKDNKKAIIWGAGLWGSRILEWIHAWNGNIEFAGFVDMEKRGTYHGYPILEKREDAIKECGTVFIALKNTKAILEIMQHLEEYGMVRNKDYFLSCNAPIRI